MNATIFNQYTYKIRLQKNPFFFDCGDIPNTVIDSSQKHYIVVSNRGSMVVEWFKWEVGNSFSIEFILLYPK